MDTNTAVIQRISSEVVRQMQSNHVCAKEGVLSSLVEQAKNQKEDGNELKSALVRMSAAIQANAQSLAVLRAEQETIVVKSERKLFAIVLSLLGGGAGGAGAVAAIIKVLNQGGGAP